MGDLLGATVSWKRVSPGHWQVMVGRAQCLLSMNDFPEEPLYTVRAFGEVLDLDDPPGSWAIEFPETCGS